MSVIRERGHLEICAVCHQVLRVVNHAHLKGHGMTVEEYDEKYARLYTDMRALHPIKKTYRTGNMPIYNKE